MKLNETLLNQITEWSKQHPFARGREVAQQFDIHERNAQLYMKAIRNSRCSAPAHKETSATNETGVT